MPLLSRNRSAANSVHELCVCHFIGLQPSKTIVGSICGCVPLFLVRQDAVGRKLAPTPCSPSNAASTTTLGPYPLIGTTASPRPLGQRKWEAPTNQRPSRRLGAHKRDIHPIRAFPCRPAERMPPHQTRRHTAELVLKPDDQTLGAGQEKNPRRRKRLHTEAVPMKGVHPIFGRTAARQALQSRKSAHRLFSRQHSTPSRALGPAVRGFSVAAPDQSMLNLADRGPQLSER